MEYIKNIFFEKNSKHIAEYQRLRKEHGDTVIDNITLEQILSGMKGIPAILCETSKLDPQTGIKFRGFSIPELREKLPRLEGDSEPLPEGLLYLMLVGEIPEYEDVINLSKNLSTRAHVPQYVFDVIDAIPRTTKPMTLFTSAIIAAAPESLFQKAYRSGIHKKYYWDFMYDDVLNLIAKLPRIAAYIYRRIYHKGKHIDPDPKLDWAGNMAHMMGIDSKQVKSLMRLYMTIHADHEGGNVSAHTTHLVGSALSNPYYAFGAGMLGLAGPLHGYANQDVIDWIFEMLEELETKNPTEEQIEEYVNKTLKSGRVIPGYGHAVLRVTDPRFTAQQEFAERNIREDYLIDIVNKLYKVVPPILNANKKVSNPWPNVDAFSGALLYHYGIKEYPFYTVMFGVARSLGVLSSLVLSRLYGLPIERPASYTLEWFKEQVTKNDEKS